MLPDGTEGCWRWSETRMQSEIEEGAVEFVQQEGEWIVYEKIYEPSEGEFNTSKYSTWLDSV